MILLALAAAAVQPAETPKQFMQRLYASYSKRDYSPFDHPDRVFAQRLAAAFAEDSKLANGEVGYLDGDPVCQCQDTAGMHATVVKVTPQGARKALVQVSIGFTGYKARIARFSLERGASGWRIADVSSADEASLLRAVEDSNRKQREKH
jgi:hypothetical protein